MKNDNSNLKDETWVIIDEFPKYMISNFGRVKNNKNRILKTSTHRDGYKQIGLRKNKKSYERKIHRLVAIAFIPNPKNKPVVNHIDEDRENNQADNLEWMTIKENNLYGNHMDNIFKSQGYKNRKFPPSSQKKKITAIYLKNNKTINFNSVKEASVSLGISASAISNVLTKRNEKMKGYTFIYNEND